MKSALNYRNQAYLTGEYFKPIVVGRKPVYPGENAEVTVKAFLEGPVTAGLRNLAVASCYLFYVPHRLVWSGFPDWVSDTESGLNLPTTSTIFTEVWDTGANVKSALFRRAYKLVYNQFFGDEAIGQGGNAWYTDPLDDTVTTVMRLKTVNQMAAHMVTDDLEVPTDTYVAPVVTSNAQIDLGELERRMRARKSNQTERFQGAKYVDYLRRCGVNVRDPLIDNPELLGAKSMVIAPTSDTATAGSTTPAVTVGDRYGKYSVTIEAQSRGKKFFPEHGYIVALAALRPVVAYTDMNYPVESALIQRDDFVITPDLQPYKEYDRAFFSTSGDPDPIMMRGFQYGYGQVNLVGSPAGVLTSANAAVNGMRYPQLAGTLNVTGTLQAKGSLPLDLRPRA